MAYRYLNLAQTEILTRASLRADVAVMIEGAPGVGKSAMANRLGKALGLRPITLQLGEIQETDLAGFLSLVTLPDGSKRLERFPLGAIRQACEGPVLLILDDYRLATPPVQGASMQLLHDRRVGDVTLHPDTRVMLCANPTDQTPGGSPLSPPARARIVLYRMRPDVAEISGFFATLGQEGSALRSLAEDFSATLDVLPDLLQLDPPDASVNGEEPWGAGRSWEKGIRVGAELLADGITDTDPLFVEALAGAVGASQAGAYVGIRAIRSTLASASEILANPTGAKLPIDRKSGIASMGVLVTVARQDPGSAWIYANRIQDNEIQTCMARKLMGYNANFSQKSASYQEGSKARARLQGRISMARQEEV